MGVRSRSSAGACALRCGTCRNVRAEGHPKPGLLAPVARGLDQLSVLKRPACPAARDRGAPSDRGDAETGDPVDRPAALGADEDECPSSRSRSRFTCKEVNRRIFAWTMTGRSPPPAAFVRRPAHRPSPLAWSLVGEGEGPDDDATGLGNVPGVPRRDVAIDRVNDVAVGEDDGSLRRSVWP